MATRRLFTVHLHNDLTGALDSMEVMAINKRDAEEIAASRTSWEWVIDSVEQH